MLKVYLIKKRDGVADDVKKWFKQKVLSRLAVLTAAPARADLFLAAGGDGTLLRAISLYGRFNKPFFGINRGTSGVLLNRLKGPEELAEVLKKFSACNFFKARLLKGEFFFPSGRKIFYAFNDFYVKSSRGNERIMGRVGGEKFGELKFDGDGLIIATPQGSTAYNCTAGGQALPLNSNKLSVKSICSRIEINKIVTGQKLKVTISRGWAAAYADHSRLGAGVKKIIVKPTKRTVTLLFKPGQGPKLTC